jgi:uncharacterized membrane protein
MDKWKGPILMLVIVSHILYFLRYPDFDILYLFALIDGIYVFASLKGRAFSYSVIAWVAMSLYLMGFSLAPFDIVMSVMAGMSVAFPAVAASQVLGFALTVFLILVPGYLLSLLVMKDHDFLQRTLLSFGLGLGMNSFVMTALGFLLNLEAVTIVVSYLFVLTLCLALVRRNIDKIRIENPIRRLKMTRDDKIILVMCLPFLLMSLMHVVFLPETYVDSLIYGVTWSKMMFEQKTIPFIGGGPSVGIGLSSNYPSAFQLLGVFMFTFTGESMLFMRLLSFTMFLFLAALVYRWTTDMFKDKRLVLLAMMLFLTMPSMILYSRVSSFYPYLVFQFSLGAYYLYKSSESKKDKGSNYLILAATMGAIGAHASFLGLLFVPFMVLFLVAKSVNFKTILIAVVVFSVVGSPWYIRNLFVFGNPFWPFGGGKFIDPAIQANTMSHLEEQSRILGFNYRSSNNLFDSVRRLLFTYIDFFDSTKRAGFRPYMTMFALPAIVLALKERDRELDLFLVWFLFILAAYTVVLNMFERYLTIITIPTIILSVYVIRKISAHRPLRYAIMAILALIFVNSVYLSFVWTECIGATRDDILYYMQDLGDHSRVLEACYGDDAKIWEWVSMNLPTDGGVATNEIKHYYMNRTLVNFDDWKLRDLYHSSEINETINVFKHNGIKYILTVSHSEEFDDYPEYFKALKRIGDNAVYEII